MILKSVEAENILKYRRLNLCNLPAHGQIAVAGANEAGKTAIGETICFALFGRTFSLNGKEPEKIIRWGEYSGFVRLEFTGRDGGDYSLVREINNTGTHDARLYKTGEQQPIAQGAEDVSRAVHEVAGFSYQSFIDSFYLAQREMEVPHAKSATIKALIGVDKLEAVASELESEIAAVTGAIDELSREAGASREEIAAINLNRAHLGRLESERDGKLAAAGNAETERDRLQQRARLIAKAKASMVDAAKAFTSSTLRTSHGQWRRRKQTIAASLLDVAKASKATGLEAESRAVAGTGAAIKPFEHGLAEYDKVSNLANLCRQRLEYFLDEEPDRDASGSDDEIRRPDTDGYRFTDRRAAIENGMDAARKSRRRLLVMGIFCIELALIPGAAWTVLRVAPESTVGAWIQAAVSLDAPVRQLVLMIAAIVGLASTALIGGLFIKAAGKLGAHRNDLETLEKEAEVARVEISVIDAAGSAPLPDALAALRGVRNDLLHSAVVSFCEGEGALLVRPAALESKLAEVRNGTETAARSLGKAQQRFADRAAELDVQRVNLGSEAAELDEQVNEERKRVDQVEVFERTIAGLEARVAELRRGIDMRRLGCTLIDATCRRIYARFHPELRRFVGKILPHLTDNRYEHLEIDEDLHVRVFCKEKNDFVGLDEISNGTHRQLMLCVRLALSQALIASSSKADQFIFFDEPFAFFDEHRMRKAVDVLRKISPQIKQVWLAAQKFDNPSMFDLFLDCSVDNDCLEAGCEDSSQVAPRSAGQAVGS